VQLVAAFDNNGKWIHHDLRVEMEFDSNADGKLNRMHLSATRTEQTETEKLKLPIIYVTSPYFAGVVPFVDGLFWNVIPEHSYRIYKVGKSEITNHRLIYVTPNLDKDLHVSGAPKGSITLTSSKSTVNL
jgi:hypothetical protein